ncbi:hypothetical protein CDAR_530961 [Caerostris darwini]|uniref:Gag-like protein n=1 Tax=Caerostris darwini TaxID=1538125 RepID=A0AAV4VU89_9ARAC|nr:hypothetical protein CDAR_530961 [Caerostris darwini]
MEPNTPNMDGILEKLLPQEGLLKQLPNDASEIMEVALNHYKTIVNLTDKKGITNDMRTEFQNNAIALVKLITKQNLKLAQLEGRIIELDKAASNKNNAPLIVSAQGTKESSKPTFAEVAKAKQTQGSKQKPKPKVQHLALIRPIEINETETSTNTKAFVQKNLDITKANIGMKRVSHIKNGGILVETVDETGISKLLKELKNSTAIKEKFSVGKPSKRTPQFICFGVSNDTVEETALACLKASCNLPAENKEIKVVHSYKSPRG